MNDARIVAVGLLTQHDLDRLGSAFSRAIPVEDDGMFDDLLAQLNDIHIEPLASTKIQLI
jgi:hypothetical protein